MLYTLPQLPYEFSALEPVISAQIMEFHYTRHHQGYVNNCNSALEKIHEANKRNDLSAMISYQAALRFNAGGHINHSIFWTTLAPIGKNCAFPIVETTLSFQEGIRNDCVCKRSRNHEI